MPPELLQRIAGAARGAVGARAGDGVERVGHVNDPREQRNLVPAQAVRIALAIRPLVMELDDRQMLREERHRAQDARSGHRMLFDRLELLVGQRPRACAGRRR